MRELAQLLNDMQAAGVIENYALFGAMAQMRYTEAVATLDADVLVAVPSAERIDVLAGIYEFCSRRNFAVEGEAIQVGAWPVQFVPVFSSLTREAMEQAETPTSRVFRCASCGQDRLAVIALSVGHAGGSARILALLEALSVTRDQIAGLAARHGLSDAWRRFEARFGDDSHSRTPREASSMAEHPEGSVVAGKSPACRSSPRFTRSVAFRTRGGGSGSSTRTGQFVQIPLIGNPPRVTAAPSSADEARIPLPISQHRLSTPSFRGRAAEPGIQARSVHQPWIPTPDHSPG